MISNINRPKWEVADVIRLFGESYLEKNHLSSSHRLILRHIEECRTTALGGHMEHCDSCGYERPVYNSCRDRHCPKCQTLTKERWLEARRSELLPVNYFHNVFTLPHDINWLVLSNKRIILGILFRSVAETLLKFGQDPRSRLGGLAGFTLILHTWNQLLIDHFHLHCVIPAGVLTDDGKWKGVKRDNFLFSVKALGLVYREKFLDHLSSAFAKGKLIFSSGYQEYQEPIIFNKFLEFLRSKDWVVYSKPPFGGPEKVLDYLSRYTHRVAISNHRLIDIDNDKVSFSYKDRGDGGKQKTATVDGQEFIRRFLLHALPSGFMRIRHYGFLANRKKKIILDQCRQVLGAKQPPPSKKLSPEELLFKLTGVDITKCPCCQAGHMVKTVIIARLSGKTLDSS